MESTFLSTTPLISFAKSASPNSRILLISSFRRLDKFKSVRIGGVKFRSQCMGTESGGGGGSFRIDDDGASGGGGGGGGDGASATVVDHVSAPSPDVITLQVGGMTCGGCAASVKRILESQPQVSSAIVDLTTEIATVWPSSDAKDGPNWQVQVGEALANHLTNCGFTSKLKGQGSNEGDTSS